MTVVNNSQRDIFVYVDSVSVNGWSVDPYSAGKSIDAGKKTKYTIITNDISLFGIKKLQDINELTITL